MESLKKMQAAYKPLILCQIIRTVHGQPDMLRVLSFIRPVASSMFALQASEWTGKQDSVP